MASKSVIDLTVEESSPEVKMTSDTVLEAVGMFSIYQYMYINEYQVII